MVRRQAVCLVCVWGGGGRKANDRAGRLFLGGGGYHNMFP
jgi:hypothetical protein